MKEQAKDGGAGPQGRPARPFGGWRVRGWMGALLAVCALCCAMPAHATQVVLVLPQQEGVYAEFGEALGGLVQPLNEVMSLTPEAQTAVQKADVVVAAGAEAAEFVVRHTRKPVLVAMIGMSRYEALRARHPDARLSAIFLDQPPRTHMALIHAVDPTLNRVAVLFDPDSAPLAAALAEVTGAGVLRLDARPVASMAAVLPILRELLTGNEALLVLPDTVVANPHIARTVLLTTYREGRPVFAYSQAYIRAGALAAVFSTPADAAQDVADWLSEYSGYATGARAEDGPGVWPAPRPPRHYSIAVNRSVAHSLGFSVASESELRLRMAGQLGYEP